MMSLLSADEVIDGLVAIVVKRVAEQIQPAPQPDWIRGAQAAADYLGCPRSRIYDLISQGKLEHERDGSRLMFRRAWLDGVYSR